MQNISFIFLIFAAANVHAAWVVQTGCNATNPICGYHAVIKNGNCVNVGGSLYAVILCDFPNSAYQNYLCYDDGCTDCFPTTRQSIGSCEQGLMSMCFVDKVDYNKILPAIGANLLYYGEINYNIQNQDCTGTPKVMRIDAANQCITNGGPSPYKVLCDGSTFTQLTFEQDDTQCTRFPLKSVTGNSGECQSWKVVAGCNIPLIH